MLTDKQRAAKGKICKNCHHFNGEICRCAPPVPIAVSRKIGVGVIKHVWRKVKPTDGCGFWRPDSTPMQRKRSAFNKAVDSIVFMTMHLMPAKKDIDYEAEIKKDRKKR